MACDIGTDIDRAVEIIRNGGLVGLPTETVYGLAANAFDPLAVARIFEAKQRPFFDPLIVHIPNVDWMPRVVSEFPALAVRLAERFWPGPLTLVLPRSEAVPDLVTSGLSNVGIRIPNHALALELLLKADCPIAAPSANLFGRISPTTAQHVAEQLGQRIDYILDGGPCRVGVESTVLKLLPSPSLLRPGGIALEDLESSIGPIQIVASTDQPTDSTATVPQAGPGMLPQHYAPQTPLFIVPQNEVPFHDGGNFNFTPTARLGGLGFREVSPSDRFVVTEVLSPAGDLQVAAAGFFAALRRLDGLGLDGIVAWEFPDVGLGRALNDRLKRAAHR